MRLAIDLHLQSLARKTGAAATVRALGRNHQLHPRPHWDGAAEPTVRGVEALGSDQEARDGVAARVDDTPGGNRPRRDGAQRFQTAGELARAFERAFDGPGGAAEEEQPPPTAVASAEEERPTKVGLDGPATDPDATRPMDYPRRASRRALWEGVAFGVLTALLAATVVFYSLGPRTRPPPEGPAAIGAGSAAAEDAGAAR